MGTAAVEHLDGLLPRSRIAWHLRAASRQVPSAAAEQQCWAPHAQQNVPCHGSTASTASPVPGFTWDYVFDWTILKYAQQQNSRPSTSRPADGGYAGGGARVQEEARDAEAALRRLGLQ